MKKSTVRIIVIALIMITVGIGLFVGGMIASGGVSAVRDVMRHGIGEKHVYEFEWDEDGFDIDLDKFDF